MANINMANIENEVWNGPKEIAPTEPNAENNVETMLATVNIRELAEVEPQE